MELTTASFVRIDLPAPPAALFATRARARPGNLLMLRRHSLTGDAIPHSVLPGIVLGFLLGGQIRCSLLIAAAYAVGGQVAAAFGPLWLGGRSSLAASGMIAVMTGLALALAILLGREHGISARHRLPIEGAATLPASFGLG